MQQLVTYLSLYPTKATTEKLYGLFNKTKIFTNPKTDNILKFIYKVTTIPGDIILEFFAGSGTAGQAVMELNQEEVDNCQYQDSQDGQDSNRRNLGLIYLKTNNT